MMARERDRDGGRWVVGTLLIVLGSLMMLQRLDLPDAWAFDGLWPLLVIAMGLARFWSRRADWRRGGGLGLVFVGLIFLLHTQDILSLRDSWPLFIVAGGVSILVGAMGDRDRRTIGDRS
jgi:drug/metabolite transporter (DMT)-like permease